MATPLRERDIGIYEYLHYDVKGIGGKLRLRCSDFLVDEIRDRDGEVVMSGSPERTSVRDALRNRTETKQHLRFVLAKAKISTVNAVKIMASFANLRPASLNFAGLKDSKAITTQEITIRDGELRALDRLNMRNIRLSSFEYVKKGLRPGYNRGNRFQIIVRGANANENQISRIVKRISTSGFVNYFGKQRFSGTATRNENCARFYLRREYGNCVDAALACPSYGCGTNEELEARRSWTDFRDASTSLKKMPKHLHFERQLLKGLIDASEYDGSSISHEDRCRTAFLSVPFPDRLLCVNAYFSRIWNRCASERVSECRDDMALEGDVVVVNDEQKVKEEGGGSKTRKQYKVVTKDDVEKKRFRIRDVVIPLPGSKTIFPEHRIGVFMKTFLQYEGVMKYGFQIEKSICRDDIHEIFGAYRTVIAIPMESRVDFQALRFDKIGVPIFPTWKVNSSSKIFTVNEVHNKVVRELAESVEKREITAKSVNGFSEQFSRDFYEHNDDIDQCSSYVALCFRFALRPGTYATSLLREIQKTEMHSSKRSCRHIIFDDNDDDEDKKKSVTKRPRRH
jgi:tRNA pseudouridine13 synthase